LTSFSLFYVNDLGIRTSLSCTILLSLFLWWDNHQYRLQPFGCWGYLIKKHTKNSQLNSSLFFFCLSQFSRAQCDWRRGFVCSAALSRPCSTCFHMYTLRGCLVESLPVAISTTYFVLYADLGLCQDVRWRKYTSSNIFLEASGHLRNRKASSRVSLRAGKHSRSKENEWMKTSTQRVQSIDKTSVQLNWREKRKNGKARKEHLLANFNLILLNSDKLKHVLGVWAVGSDVSVKDVSEPTKSSSSRCSAHPRLSQSSHQRSSRPFDLAPFIFVESLKTRWHVNKSCPLSPHTSQTLVSEGASYVADERSLSVLICDEAFFDNIDSPLAFAFRRESFSLRRSISRSRSSWDGKKSIRGCINDPAQINVLLYISVTRVNSAWATVHTKQIKYGPSLPRDFRAR
jgi:hypothetical protein